MSTITENLNTIKNSIDRMKTALNLPANTPLEDVTTNVEHGGGSVKSNIYRVGSIAERDAITDMVEGDMCVVYDSVIKNVDVNSKFKTAIFPDTVVLDTAITDYVDIRYRAVDESVMFDCMGQLDSSNFMMDCYTDSGNIRINYTSSDGITYTRTDTTGNPVDFGTEIYYGMPDMWNDAIGHFIQASTLSFPGIFTYEERTTNIRKAKDLNNNDIMIDFNVSEKMFMNGRVTYLIYNLVKDSNGIITEYDALKCFTYVNNNKYDTIYYYIDSEGNIRRSNDGTSDQLDIEISHHTLEGFTETILSWKDYIDSIIIPASELTDAALISDNSYIANIKDVNGNTLYEPSIVNKDNISIGINWYHSNIGVSSEPSDILLNIKSYTNKGTITGTRDINKYREDFVRIQDNEPENKLGLWIKLKPDVSYTYNQQNTFAILPGSLNENNAIKLDDITKSISTKKPATTTSKDNSDWCYYGDGYLHGDIYYTHNNGKTYLSKGIKIVNYLYTFPTHSNYISDNSNTLVEKINLDTLEITSLANFPVENKFVFSELLYDGNDIISMPCPICRKSDDSQYTKNFIYLYSISKNEWTTVSVSETLDYSSLRFIKDGEAYIRYKSSSKNTLAKYNLTTGVVSSTDISKNIQSCYYNAVDGNNGYLYTAVGHKFSTTTFELKSLIDFYNSSDIISYENTDNILTLFMFDYSYNLIKMTIDKNTDDVVVDTIKLNWDNKVYKDINNAFIYELNNEFILLGGYDKTDGTNYYKKYKISKDSIDYSRPFDLRRPFISPNNGSIIKLFTDYSKGKEVSITLYNKIYLSDVYTSSNNYENNYVSKVYIGDGKKYTLFKEYS